MDMYESEQRKKTGKLQSVLEDTEFSHTFF
jgi:hypothetical protein